MILFVFVAVGFKFGKTYHDSLTSRVSKLIHKPRVYIECKICTSHGYIIIINMPCPRIPVLHPVKRFRENDLGIWEMFLPAARNLC